MITNIIILNILNVVLFFILSFIAFYLTTTLLLNRLLGKRYFKLRDNGKKVYVRAKRNESVNSILSRLDLKIAYIENRELFNKVEITRNNLIKSIKGGG